MRTDLKRVLVGTVVLGLMSTLFSQCDAQNRDRRGRGGDDFLRSAGLELGKPLPDAAGYTADGKPFSLTDIKGSYAVIVCGCMT